MADDSMAAADSSIDRQPAVALAVVVLGVAALAAVVLRRLSSFLLAAIVTLGGTFWTATLGLGGWLCVNIMIVVLVG